MPNAPLRILLTNVWLLDRTGTETLIRDFAVNLRRRGHDVTVFALKLGAPAAELSAAGITVTDTLATEAQAPDIVFGGHCVPVVLALAQFPETPAIWLSQDTRYWYDQPPQLSRITEWLAIDDLRRAFLIGSLKPGTAVGRFRNAVDLTRIAARAEPLPERPRRLLAFTKTDAQLATLGEVCGIAGLEFAALGRGARREVVDPENELVRHDIVVATGRSAIEAVVSGCAVILGDARGVGGMVTSQNLDTLRDQNFGSAALTEPFTTDAIVQEIARYDRADAELVSRVMRERADLEPALTELEQIARGAVEKARHQRGWTREDCRVLRRFVEEWPPRDQGPGWQFLGERERLKALSAAVDQLFDRAPWGLGAVRDFLGRRRGRSD